MAAGDDVKLFSLYPVPLRFGRLSVQMNVSGSGVSSIEVRNLIGKRIQEKKLPSGSDMITFDAMDVYPDGVYIVLAKDANGKVLEILKFNIDK
jgi:hypothetical protein